MTTNQQAFTTWMAFIFPQGNYTIERSWLKITNWVDKTCNRHERKKRLIYLQLLNWQFVIFGCVWLEAAKLTCTSPQAVELWQALLTSAASLERSGRLRISKQARFLRQSWPSRTLCRLGKLCQHSLKQGFPIRAKFARHQFERWHGIQRQTGYSIHFLITVILILLFMILLFMFCMLYSDNLFILIVLPKLERVLCEFAGATLPFSPAQILTKLNHPNSWDLSGLHNSSYNWTLVLWFRIPVLVEWFPNGFKHLVRLCEFHVFQDVYRSASSLATRHVFKPKDVCFLVFSDTESASNV